MAAKKTSKTLIPGYVSDLPKKPDPLTMKVAKAMHAETRAACKRPKSALKAPGKIVLSAGRDGKAKTATASIGDITAPWKELDPMFRDNYYFQAERVLKALEAVKIAEAKRVEKAAERAAQGA
jgi:hypothetical protein